MSASIVRQRRSKCGWTGRGRYRPVRCTLVASWVIIGPRGAAIRCMAHARNALDALERCGTAHTKCRLPSAVRS